MKLTEFIQDVGRPVAFYPGLRRITGSTTATLLLCQLIYWTGKQADPNGWIYKTSEDLEEETGLSYDEQVTARKQLVKNGFIEERYKRLDHQMSFRIMANAINEKWRKPEYGIGETQDTSLGKADLGQSLIRDAESTSENTPENTPEIEPYADIFSHLDSLIGPPVGGNSDVDTAEIMLNEFGEERFKRAAAWAKEKSFSAMRTALRSMNTALTNGGFQDEKVKEKYPVSEAPEIR